MHVQPDIMAQVMGEKRLERIPGHVEAQLG